MRNDLSELVLVIDRSGSMQACRDDAEGGVNQFVEDQKKAAGEANLTLVQFDDEYEVVHDGTPIQDVQPYSLAPRGMTALLDAVGTAITSVGCRLSAMAEDDRPATVVVAIVTDGHENASHEYSLEQIRSMITEQQEKYNWKFTFLGADASAFDTGASMGIARSAVAQYDAGENTGLAFAAVSQMTGAARNAGMFQTDYKVNYTDEQRKSMS